MSVTRRDVEKVALLARLQLNDSELERMTEQLGQIVHYVDSLSAADTEGVQPMAHAVEMANIFRADAVAASLDREAALANAPRANGEAYLVPAVFAE